MPAEPHDHHAVAFSDFLRSFTRVIAARPWVTLILLTAVCVASSLYTSRNLQFKNDRGDLIDPNADFQKRWLEYTKSFGEASDIVVVVEGKNAEDITPVLDDLGERLIADDEHFESVFFRVEHDALRRKGLQYLTPDQLEMVLAQVQKWRPAIEGDWESINLESVLKDQILIPLQRLRVAARTSGLDTPIQFGMSPRQLMELVGLHVTSLATSMTAALNNPEDASNPWPQLVKVDGNLTEAAMKPTYFLNERGTQGFLRVAPIIDKADFNGATAAVQRMRDIVADVRHNHPHVRIGLTGIPVLENDEMVRSQKDMTLSTIVSFVGVIVLMLAGFHGIRHPFIAAVMLTVGMILSFAFATAAVGHLNILSASFAPILMGLGCDYAIMYLSRYLELRHEGQSLDDALGNSSASVGGQYFDRRDCHRVGLLLRDLHQVSGCRRVGNHLYRRNHSVRDRVVLCVAAADESRGSQRSARQVADADSRQRAPLDDSPASVVGHDRRHGAHDFSRQLGVRLESRPAEVRHQVRLQLAEPASQRSRFGRLAGSHLPRVEELAAVCRVVGRLSRTCS